MFLMKKTHHGVLHINIMLKRDLFSETIQALLINKTRTMLTILGIVIGISSVIVMIAVGQGTQTSVMERIQSIGSNLLVVSPGAQGGRGGYVNRGSGSLKSLTMDDVAAIQNEIPLIEAVSPQVVFRKQLVTRGNNVNTSVFGVVQAYKEVRNIKVAEGLFIDDSHEKRKAKVVVLGPNIAQELFGVAADSIVGEKVRIASTDFTIIGVAQSKGGSGFRNVDENVYIPLSTAQQFFQGDDYLSAIDLSVIDQEQMAEAQQQVTEVLLRAHRIDDFDNADFSIFNQGDIVETASSVTQTLTLLLGAVAGISLVVGGIGIMNMMLTTVTERRREIGLRKSIGAKNRDINMQFLLEAVTLTLIGGIFGVLLGLVVVYLFNRFNIIAEVSLGAIVLAFSISAIIGIVFGYYPAQRAAKLSPIEALRYE